MPIKSKAQRRYLWAKEPEIARRFEDETKDGKKLPEKVSRRNSAIKRKLEK